jgi:transposase
MVVVADRGLLSVDNIGQLEALALSDGRQLEFILAVPGRRYAEFDETLEPLQARCLGATEEVVAESAWQGHRLIVAHAPERACEQTAERRARIAALEARAAHLAGKLDAQDAGARARGRRLSDSGAKARFFHEVSEAGLARIVKVDLKSDLFTYEIDSKAQARAERMDGKLLLVSNVAELTAPELVERYKALADIERGFRVLKSEIAIAPVYHRLPERIRAHASLCFMALILYRAMRMRLAQAGSDLSPEAALARLRRIQRHTIAIDGSTPISGISSIDNAQASVLAALKIGKPAQSHSQMSLL